MAYKVIIAEDEPAASRHLLTLIEQKCPGYQVICCTENGDEALESIEQDKPDLLLTDIRMPGMNGIDLARQAKQKLPSLRCVVISGYQNFDYAKGAIQAGVDDYLLKPVSPRNFMEILEKITGHLDESYYHERCILLRSLAADVYVEQWKLKKYLLGAGTYWLGVFRENSLPGRFRGHKAIEQFSEQTETLCLYGRDEKEMLFLCPCESMRLEEFRLMLAGYEEKVKEGYSTIIMMPEAVYISELPEAVNRLYQELRCQVVFGQSRFLIWGKTGKKPYFRYALKTGDIGRIQQSAQNGMIRALRQEIADILSRCIRDNCPQLYLEDISRQFFYLIRTYNETYEWADSFEYMLDDAFFFALNAEDLVGSL
ncbi:MAG: response regulator, partial [Tannerella sp.]|nr:response regulator [Tannerella sp.]